MPEEKKNEQIPTDAGKHHTWGTAKDKDHKGTHRKSDRNEEEEKKDK